MNEEICPFAKLDRLLVATDGSTFSEFAINEALTLAKRFSSKLIVVSVIKTNLEFEMSLPQVAERDEKAAIELLELIKAKASREDIDCEILVLRGEEPYQDIINAAETNRVNLIVMGRHGKTGIKKFVLGSVTAQVVRHAPCNVLVVPPKGKIKYETILIAADDSKHNAAAAVEAVAIAKRCSSILFIVSVTTSEAESSSAEENVKQVIELAEKESIKNEWLIVQGKPHEAIAKISNQKDVDLIIVGSHGRTGLMDFLMGGVAERVLGRAESAVLVVKTNDT
jgi:nucleotide-binding universal stress UspA family protein